MTATVLTIEDQPDIRRLIRMTLEFKGFEVLEASTGEEGLSMVRRHKPSLILLDVMMPGIDGLTVARTLRADPELSRIPTLMLTAMGTSDDIEAGMETGVRGYLVKPFSPWQLLEQVEQLIHESAAP